MPKNRMVFYLLVLGLLPFLFLGLHFNNKRKELSIQEQQVDRIWEASVMQKQKQAVNNMIRVQHADADPHYLEHHLGPLLFLAQERQAIETIMKNQTFTGNEAMEKRFSFLSGENNRLLFSEGTVLTGEGVQETTQVLSHPVEIDASDLRTILHSIEGEGPKKPQLVITDFRLTKKEMADKNEVFEFSINLLQREFISSW